MKRARFVDEAREEFLAEVRYYTERQSGLGAEFVAEVEAAVRRALVFPLMGSVSASNTRKIIVKRFPFFVVYRPESDGIVIFAIAHHSREPNYWHERMQKR
ncbi:MAG: type II toxin-antitoxin system RelE/ParE family toxin [Burkholderiales bacterium]